MKSEATAEYRKYMKTPVERRLRDWGAEFGTRPEDPEKKAEAEGSSPIGRIAVDRTREGDIERNQGFGNMRPTRSRRRLIQERVGEKCRVPAWAGGDPVRCTETRTRGPEWQPDPECEQIEKIVLELGRWDRRAAIALRACYCLLGRRPMSERITWAARASQTNITRTGYRAAVQRGRLFVEAALAGKSPVDSMLRSQRG